MKQLHFLVPFSVDDIDYENVIAEVATKLFPYGFSIRVYFVNTVDDIPANAAISILAHGNFEKTDIFFSKSGDDAKSVSKKSVFSYLCQRNIMTFKDYSCSTSIDNGGVLLNLSTTANIIADDIKKSYGFEAFEFNSDSHWDVRNQIEGRR